MIVVDEAHQHTVSTDLLLGLLKELAIKRATDLKIVIMSATIDTEQFKAFFPGSAVHEVEGRTFPVQHEYLQEPVSMKEMVPAVVKTIMDAHLTERSGDILVFVAGVPQITKIISQVSVIMEGGDNIQPRYSPDQIGELHCYPLYSGLSKREQDRIIESIPPPPRFGKHSRKVIVSTNIAETSVTLPGVTIVIDSLLANVQVTNPENESSCLTMSWVSQAVAKQRSGRAGRVRAGKAYRMCTRDGFYTSLAGHTVPEMQNCDMVEECMTILQMGRHPMHFPYISPPATETVIRALGTLITIGAIQYGHKLELTPRGDVLSRLPIDIGSALMVFESVNFDCQDEILSVVAMIAATKEGGGSLFIPQASKEDKAALKDIMAQFGQQRGDHIMYLNVYLAWRQACMEQTSKAFLETKLLNGSLLKAADDIRITLLKHLTNGGDCSAYWPTAFTPTHHPRYYTQVLCAIAAGGFMRVARRVAPKASKTASKPGADMFEIVRSGDHAKLSSRGCIPAADDDWIVFSEYSTAGEKELRLVTPVPLELMIQSMPVAWCDYNLTGYGDVTNDVVKTLMRITGCTEELVRRAMPANQHQSTQ